MSKHSTTPRTLSRRLAALLAALALLAAMALPVYAEALDGASQMQETVETDNNGETDNKVEAGSDVKTDDKSETNEGTDTGTGTESEDTKDNDSPNPGANSTTPADNAAADNTAPYEEKTDLTEEDTADDGEGPADEAGAKETLFAADTCSEDETGSSDMSAPVAASNEGEKTSFIPKTATIYFAVDSAYQDNYRVNLFVEKDGSGLNKDMSDTGETITGNDGKKYKIFSVTLLSQADYPGGGFDRLIFQYFDGPKPENWKKNFFGFGGENTDAVYKSWTSIDKIAGKMYVDQKSNQGHAFNESQWTRVEYYYAGMPLYFKNASGTLLAGVTATFYKKDKNGDFVVTGSQTIGTVAANTIAGQKITIPNNQSQFVKFTWTGNDGGTLYYNFSNEVCDDITQFDLVTNNCFVYSGSAESSWQNAGGDLLTAGKTIYFDSTFSSYAYAGENTPQNAMPKTDDDGNAKMYCFLQKADGLFDTVEMTSAPDPNALGRQLWSCEIPKDGKTYTAVQFSATNDRNAAAKDDKTKVYSTANIPPTLQEPCFFADNGDPTAYTYSNGDVYREGYWGEKSAVRDAESGKGTTVVDIDNTTPFVRNSATKYVTTTLYDYYTDWELNGNNRDKYNVANGMSQRNWVTFRQFDQALSDYYIAYNNTNKEEKSVVYPIYTGHFQPEAKDENGNTWGCPFKDVANSLNLYGYNESDKNKFMAVNNSTIDVNGVGLNNGDTRYYDDAFQGLTGDELVNGEPVLYNTKLTVPYFNKDFLEGANSKKAVLGKVYENVDFPFTKEDVFGNGINYWYYESNDKSLFLKQKEGTADQYFLQQPAATVVKGKMVSNNAQNVNSTSGPLSTYGFFPFNEGSGDTHANTYNYGFGAKLQFDFTLTDDGQVLGNGGKEVPIQFFFSGDDDVWVYIDDKLALDVGGDHGKVSGLLEFGLNSDKKLVYTPYVSDVKASNADRMYTKDLNCKSVNYREADKQYKTRSFNYKGDQKEISAGKHTLKFFYMERGMWESNMAIAFNFPDHNELQVKKEVNVIGVNELFQNCFTDKRLFNFTIRNQATHYGTNDAKGDTVTTINLLEPNKSTPEKKDFTTTATHAPGTSGENRFEIVKSPPKKLNVTDGTPLLNWYTQFEDLTPSPGFNKEKRYGILRLDGDKTIDITGMSYLSFDVYVDSNEGDAALSNMYLQLRDSSDKKKGCLGQTFIGGKDLYGQVEMHNNRWITVKLSLDDVKAEEGFDEKRVKELRFGCNYPRSIYLRNIVFSSKAVPQTVTGFTTKQEDIADYGSAQKGELMPAVNAQYTSDAEKGTMVVDKNGGFVLKAGETISFKDQFRRGSYLSINEQVDKNLFDTQWTIYEDGKAVNEIKAGTGNKLTLDVNHPVSLKDQTGTAPDDGRIENVNAEDNAQNGNSYKGEKPSTKNKDDNTIVFRSYANPDATDAEGETQLKVVFVNTVKTGSLTIVKQQAKGSDPLKGTYHFKVRFTNVGGHALEDEAIEKEYTAKVDEPCVIENIPVGTRFTIKEVTPTDDGSKLTNASVTGGGSGTMVLNNQTVRGSIVAGVAGDKNQAVATFTNTKQETLDITGTKIWKNADNAVMTGSRPTIYVQLQRHHKGESEWKAVEYRDNEPYQTITDGYGDMTFSFLGLPAKDYSIGDKPDFEYRVVEGYLDDMGVFQAVEDKGTITIDEKVYGVTYEYTNPEPDAANTNNAKQTVTITNRQQDPKFTLDITKADAEDGKTLLKDVEFTLEKMKNDDNGNTVADASFGTLKGKTNGQGKLMWEKDENSEVEGFTELKAGTYRLTETKAAENYNLLSAPILVTFTTDGTCTLNGSTIEVSTKGNKPTEFTKNEDGSYTLSLTVLNRKTPALPHTGADAPSLWLLIGLPLAVAGLLILVFRYNKKGGRTR